MSDPGPHNPVGEFSELAYLYALDAVSDSEHAAITHELEAPNPRTAREFNSIVRMVREVMAIITGVDTPPPPAELKARINAAIDEHDSHKSDELAAARVTRRRRLTRSVAAVAATVAIGLGAAAVGGVFNTHSPSGPTVAQVMHAPDARTVTAGVAGGSLMIATSRHADAAVVMMSNVAPPPIGHVYQMWLMPRAGTARLVGTMDAARMPPPGGEVLTHVGSATTVTMTVEPGNGSSQPTNPPIVSIALAE